jgi:leader peptidase (prepilin peptidase)/N-methyltransferase
VAGRAKIVILALGGLAGLVAGVLSDCLARSGGKLRTPDFLSAGLALVGGVVLALWVRDETDVPSIAVKAAVLLLLSVVLASDVRERAVYPLIVYPSVVCSIVAAPLLGISQIEALSGAAVGGFVFALLFALARLLYGPGALGAGDVSVAVLLGATVGLPRLPVALLLVGIIGAGLALLAGIRARSMRATFAYAPALSLAAMTTTLLYM